MTQRESIVLNQEASEVYVQESKQTVKLADGRNILFTRSQARLFHLCKLVESLPREIIDQILLQLPSATLLSLKNVQGLREVVLDVASERLLEDSRPQCSRQDLPTCLKLSIRDAVWSERSLGDHTALVTGVMDVSNVPSLRYFVYDCPRIRSEDTMEPQQARSLLQSLGALPLLSRLELGGYAAEYEIPVTLAQEDSNGDMNAPFPSLQELALWWSSPAFSDLMLSGQYALSRLIRLDLGGLDSNIAIKTFPRRLVVLTIDGCPSVGFETILELVRLSKDTLKYLWVFLKRPYRTHTLDTYLPDSEVHCPRLEYMAVHDLDHWGYHVNLSEEGEVFSPGDWPRQAMIFMSHISAPNVHSVGIGISLEKHPSYFWAEVTRLMVRTANIVCRHVPAFMDKAPLPGADASDEEDGSTAAAANSHQLMEEICEHNGVNLLCFDEGEYEAYFHKASVKIVQQHVT